MREYYSLQRGRLIHGIITAKWTTQKTEENKKQRQMNEKRIERNENETTRHKKKCFLFRFVFLSTPALALLKETADRQCTLNSVTAEKLAEQVFWYIFKSEDVQIENV